VPWDKIFQRCQAAALPHDYDCSVALEKRIAALRSKNSPTLLYVGRLSPEKNLLLLLEAFQKLSQELPNCILKLVGEGPERKDLESAVARLGLAKRVVFVGGLTGSLLFGEYTHATCLVLPSSSEPWGLVVNEALSFGCPVVVSDRCGCVPELVLEGTTGFKFRTFDATDLEEKMRLAISLSFDDEKVAKTCIQLMTNFSPASSAKAMLQGFRVVSGDLDLSKWAAAPAP
jgi:glycosyltransferase involved in cell wall biosynthesis